MKKRKPFTFNQTRSSRDIRTPQLLPLQSVDSNSSKDGLTSCNKTKEVYTKHSIASPRSKASIKGKSVYESLESLFPLHKDIELYLEDYQCCYPPVEQKTEDSNLESESESELESEFQFGEPEDFTEKLKCHFLEETFESPADDHVALHTEINLSSENFEKIEDIAILSEIEEDSISSIMADENEQEVNPETEPVTESAVEENPVTNETEAAEIVVDEPVVDKTLSEHQTQISIANTDGEKQLAHEKSVTVLNDKTSVFAPESPLPEGLGGGVPVGPGKHRESVMSSVPITESSVIQQMECYHERARMLKIEIQTLKNSINELTNKKELSEEDTIVLKDKQDSVMGKISELNDITRVIERVIGLVDPSTPTFAKMFELLPYPHNKVHCEEKPCQNVIEGPKEPCERFAFPQIDYPEDRLPRVIVCGSTEDQIPKIVVPDSRPKSRGNKCIENLTGRLSESLCLQDKLAKENAELEGGKFALERELLEKDNAVECLEGKVRGLQDEKRFLVKENYELNRKINCLLQQSCSSPRSIQSPQWSPVAENKCQSPRQTLPSPVRDLSCKCSARERKNQTARPPAEATNFCKSPVLRGGCDPTRLAGGASREEINGLLNCKQNRPVMYNNYRNGISTNSTCTKSPLAMSQGSPRGGAVCPAEIDERIATYDNYIKCLVDQVSSVENEMQKLQVELRGIQHERQQLDQEQKLLQCANPCATCVCCPELTKPSNVQPKNNQDLLSCSPCNDAPEASNCAAQQLRDLREQYARLQEDYKDKLCEVSRQRTDAESLKRENREAREERERMEIKLVDTQERLRSIESERNELLGTREQLVEQEQALLVARQRFREAQDELEELRSMIRDQASQLDDYRSKYLQAQQQVEEQRRQMEIMEMDNARMNENVALEIGRVKNQFQEKLAEIAPLPDILKQTQIKLQETQQQRLMAEHNCEDLSRELLTAKDKMDSMLTQINDLQREIQALNDERSNGGSKLEELEKKNGELRNEIERFKNAISRLEEQQTLMQKRFDEKQHEAIQLSAMVEQVREDSARQVSRTKERCEAIKRSMQAQISDFELQLAQCRAVAKTAQKEKDEIRLKMQGQIGNLNEALQQAQGRIKSMQGHVEYLKVSYSNVFGGQGPGESTTLIPRTEPPIDGQGYDSCDCNH